MFLVTGIIGVDVLSIGMISYAAYDTYMYMHTYTCMYIIKYGSMLTVLHALTYHESSYHNNQYYHDII